MAYVAYLAPLALAQYHKSHYWKQEKNLARGRKETLRT